MEEDNELDEEREREREGEKERMSHPINVWEMLWSQKTTFQVYERRKLIL